MYLVVFSPSYRCPDQPSDEADFWSGGQLLTDAWHNVGINVGGQHERLQFKASRGVKSDKENIGK